MQNATITNINIESLVPNAYQPRENFNEQTINELALSIKEYGILNPILVRKVADKYEIIAGERRVRAAKKVGLTEVPAIIKDIDDAKMAEIALIENLQRENITPIEEAKSYQSILNNSKITEQQLSELIGKSQPFIANKLRLLNLTDEVKEALVNRKISERHARTLLKINNPEKQRELLINIIANRLTVKELDSIIEKELEKEDTSDSIENKEDKKDSDKMNNESFFPNFNNEANNVSLNAINMQANTQPGMPMPQGQPMPEQQAPVMPETVPQAPIPQVAPSPLDGINSFVNDSTPNIPTASINNQDVALQNMPTLNPEPLTTQPEQPAEPPVNPDILADIPLFSSQPAAPEPVIREPAPAPEPTPMMPALEVGIPDIPVATPAAPAEPMINPIDTIMPQSEPTVEVPIAVATETTVSELDRIEGILNANNIPHKTYNNETGSCIIIEI